MSDQPNYDRETGGLWSQLRAPNWFLNLPEQTNWLNDSTIVVPGTGAGVEGTGFSVPVNLPDWASSYGSPREFADAWSKLAQLDPAGAAHMAANMQSGWQTRQDYLARFDEATGYLKQFGSDIQSVLGPLMEQFRGDSEGAANDPYRQAVLEGFKTRADPNYSVISAGEQAQAHQQIGQQVAQARAIEQAHNANRGINPSGYSVQRDQDLLSRGYATRAAYDANVRGINEAAQQTALAGLGQSVQGFEGLDITRGNQMASLAGTMLGLEGGQVTNLSSLISSLVEMPDDMLAPFMLQLGLEQYAEGKDAAAEEAQFDPIDLLSYVIQLASLNPVQKLLGF